MSSIVYEVNLAGSAKKEVKLLDTGIRARVIHAFRSLANNPRPPGIDDSSHLVEIVAVRHRSKAYG